jgi:flagellar hook-length control protein FliK
MSKDKAGTTDRAAPLTQQVVTESGKATKAVSGEIGKSSPNGPVPEKRFALAKEHAGMKPIEAKANAGSDVPPTTESSKSHGLGTERRLPSNAGRMDEASDKPSTQVLHNAHHAAREVRSQARPSRVAGGENTQAGQAVNGVAMSDGRQDMRPSQPGDNLMTLSGPAMSGAGRSTMISQAVSDPPFTAGGMSGAADKGAAQSIGEQIRDSMHTSLARGEQQVMIRLRPPELGSVLVRFGEQNGQIQGVLEVTRGQTRHEVEQALPEVLRNLQDLGIHVRRLDVTVCDQSGEDPGGQQLQQDAWPQREGSDRYARPSNLDGRSSDFESEKAGVPASISVPAGRIDMLV